MIVHLRIAFIIFFILISRLVFSQEDDRVLIMSSDPEEVLDAFGERLIGKKGTFFLDMEWIPADIFFRSGLIVKDFPTRYDIEFNLLEIRIGDRIKVLPIGKLLKYEILDPESGRIIVYGSGRNYKTEHGTPVSGLCRIHERGDWAVITNINYSIKDPDYVKQLDVGNKEKKLFIKEDSYLCIDMIAHPLSMKKKDLISHIGNKSKKAKSYLEQEKLNPKRENDLKDLIDYVAGEI